MFSLRGFYYPNLNYPLISIQYNDTQEDYSSRKEGWNLLMISTVTTVRHTLLVTLTHTADDTDTHC